MDALHGRYLNGWRKSLIATTQECCDQYWRSPGGNTPESSRCAATYYPSQKRTRRARHCWRSRDELIRDVLQWTPSHGRAKGISILMAWQDDIYIYIWSVLICGPISKGCRIHWLHHCRGLKLLQRVSWIWYYTMRWWGSSNAGALGNAEYPFITIALWSTLSRNGSTCRVLSMGQIELDCLLMLNWILWNQLFLPKIYTYIIHNCLKISSKWLGEIDWYFSRKSIPFKCKRIIHLSFIQDSLFIIFLNFYNHFRLLK